MDDNFSSSQDTLSRLVRLETKVHLKFEEIDKAIVLARDMAEKEKMSTKADLDYRLAGMNEFRETLRDQAGTFATKEAVSRLERLVSIGIGVVMAVQFILMFLK